MSKYRAFGPISAAFGAFALASVLISAACGGIELRNGDADASTSTGKDGASSTSSDGGGAPWPGDTFDGSVIDTPHPDGGPIPKSSCDDAGTNEAGVECPLPASFCIDDHWERYYYGGYCSDAGVCELQATDIHCEPSGTPPDCYQGGCRVVIVR